MTISLLCWPWWCFDTGDQYLLPWLEKPISFFDWKNILALLFFFLMWYLCCGEVEIYFVLWAIEKKNVYLRSIVTENCILYSLQIVVHMDKEFKITSMQEFSVYELCSDFTFLTFRNSRNKTEMDLVDQYIYADNLVSVMFGLNLFGFSLGLVNHMKPGCTWKNFWVWS